MHYHVNIKETKWFFQQWEKHESLFPTIGFLDQHILRIPWSQIEIEHISSLVGILIDLKKHCLQFDNLENWLNDHKVNCRTSFNLMELIDMDIELQEELIFFEGSL